MQKGYHLYPSEYKFKYSTRLQPACSYHGKSQTNYTVLTFCDFKHGVIWFTITDQAIFKEICKLWIGYNIS